jgi:hypothetical protein
MIAIGGGQLCPTCVMPAGRGNTFVTDGTHLY